MPGPGGGLGPRGFLTDEEKQNKPKVTGKLLKRILSYLKPYWFQFLLVFITILISALVGLLPSILTGKIVDNALVGRDLALLDAELHPHHGAGLDGRRLGAHVAEAGEAETLLPIAGGEHHNLVLLPGISGPGTHAARGRRDFL